MKPCLNIENHFLKHCVILEILVYSSKEGVVFHFKDLKSLYPSMLCTMFVWNLQSGTGNIFWNGLAILLYYWKSSSLEPLGQLNQTWHKAFLGWTWFKVVEINAKALFEGEIMWKCIDTIKNKKFFYGTTRSISTNLGTKHPYVKGTKDFTKKDYLIL